MISIGSEHVSLYNKHFVFNEGFFFFSLLRISNPDSKSTNFHYYEVLIVLILTKLLGFFLIPIGHFSLPTSFTGGHLKIPNFKTSKFMMFVDFNMILHVVGPSKLNWVFSDMIRLSFDLWYLESMTLNRFNTRHQFPNLKLLALKSKLIDHLSFTSA